MSAYRFAKKEIPGLLEKFGPLPKFRIAEMLGEKDSRAVGDAMDWLCEEGCIKRLGRADENGLTQFRAHAILFALRGWQPARKTPVAKSCDEIAGGEYAMAKSRTYANIIFPGAGSRRGL
jgi:hypothetical protein